MTDLLNENIPGPEDVDMPRVLDRLDSLSTLKLNWGGDDEAAPDPEIIEQMKTVLRVLSTAPSIVPTWGGGVQAEWHIYGMDIEIELDPEQPPDVWISGW